MKGKIHGTIDVLSAVISTEKEEDRKARRIDIDTEEFLYHVKVRQVPFWEDSWTEEEVILNSSKAFDEGPARIEGLW